MNPEITNFIEKNNIMKFTLEDVNISIANSLRRVVLSEIPCLVFKTYPYSECDAIIETNTSRMNNEVIKQRLSCIPIHETNFKRLIDDFILEIDESNNNDNSSTIKVITTEDFKIKHIKSEKYMKKEEVSKIFPPDKICNEYIDFVRLMPKYGNVPGEKLKLTSKFSEGCAKDDYMFNVVSNCSYGFSQDNEKVAEIWQEKETQMIQKNIKKEEIAMAKKDFYILDAQRIFKKDEKNQPNSFDFTIESLGIYSNNELVNKACYIIINKLNTINEIIQSSSDLINKSNVTINNSYDITLNNEDYTIGKVIEFMFNEEYLKNKKVCNFVGFIKEHPHIDVSILRLAFVDNIDTVLIIKDYFANCIKKLINIYNRLNNKFKGKNVDFIDAETYVEEEGRESLEEKEQTSEDDDQTEQSEEEIGDQSEEEIGDQSEEEIGDQSEEEIGDESEEEIGDQGEEEDDVDENTESKSNDEVDL